MSQKENEQKTANEAKDEEVKKEAEDSAGVKPEEAKAEAKPEAEEAKKPSEAEKAEQQISVLKALYEKEKAQEEDWKNKYYQAYADLSNTRKSLEKDHETFIKYRAQGFIEKILPTLDSFEMASKAKTDDPAVKKYAEGYQMIHRQLEQALTEEGVSFIEPKQGTAFDPNKMHAIQTAPGAEDNKVVAIYVKGYMLHDRLIRPAMVVVSKKEEEPASDKKDDKKDDKAEK